MRRDLLGHLAYLNFVSSRHFPVAPPYIHCNRDKCYLGSLWFGRIGCCWQKENCIHSLTKGSLIGNGVAFDGSCLEIDLTSLLEILRFYFRFLHRIFFFDATIS